MANLLSPKKLFVSEGDIERIRTAPDLLRLKDELCKFLVDLLRELSMLSILGAADTTETATGTTTMWGTHWRARVDSVTDWVLEYSVDGVTWHTALSPGKPTT